MRKSFALTAGIVFLSMMVVVGFSSPAPALDIEIDVAPNTINLQSRSIVVTVHTDIAYIDVDTSTVYLGIVDAANEKEVPISWWKADDRGNFVAKFNADDVKDMGDLKIGYFNNLVLSGQTTANAPEKFSGTQEVLFFDSASKRQRR